MAIPHLTRDQFSEILHRELHPTAPISSPEFLAGREDQLEDIRRAIGSVGRQLFVFGDRGVGKTSLASTAAHEHQSSEKPPIFVACDPRSTFATVIGAIERWTEDHEQKSVPSKLSGAVKSNFGGIPLEISGAYETQGKNEPKSQVHSEHLDVNLAIEIVRRAVKGYAKRTVVIVDEFDLLKNDDDKRSFASFIKQLGDQQVDVRFIFAGIGRSLDDLFGAHDSCFRYVHSIPLERLYFGPRWSIIDKAANALQIKVDDHSRYRIAAVSDGFPHYIHLVCEQLFWEMFDDKNATGRSTTPQMYSKAIGRALQGISPQLKKPYEKATLRDADEFEDILWAVADHADLQRSIDSIEASYRRIMGRRNRTPLGHDMFVRRLNQLKSKSCAEIVRNYGARRSWYEFSESVIRGYVRLRAEQARCPLALEYDSPGDPVQITAGGNVRMKATTTSQPGRLPRPGDNLK